MREPGFDSWPESGDEAISESPSASGRCEILDCGGGFEGVICNCICERECETYQ